MAIIKHGVADKIAAYLHHEITLPQLADWPEPGMDQQVYALYATRRGFDGQAA